MKKFNMTIDKLYEVINSIPEYSGRCEEYSTLLDQNASRWKYRKHYDFQKSLEEGGLYYFAYIKFYMDDGTPYAIVAGKSGSNKVNSRGCDLKFHTYPRYNGEAKKWLSENDKEWCKTKILVIRTISTDRNESEKEAFAIENDLFKRFGLLES